MYHRDAHTSYVTARLEDILKLHLALRFFVYIMSIHVHFKKNDIAYLSTEPQSLLNRKAMPLLSQRLETLECQTHNRNTQRGTKICTAARRNQTALHIS